MNQKSQVLIFTNEKYIKLNLVEQIFKQKNSASQKLDLVFSPCKSLKNWFFLHVYLIKIGYKLFEQLQIIFLYAMQIQIQQNYYEITLIAQKLKFLGIDIYQCKKYQIGIQIQTKIYIKYKFQKAKFVENQFYFFPCSSREIVSSKNNFYFFENYKISVCIQQTSQKIHINNIVMIQFNIYHRNFSNKLKAFFKIYLRR
eukprot:TRINITY_DN1234_c0_g2_i4.p2 TRINITY_DN1234_c0_g2~~TRINITY_DN1234_c0_g2_i4.p2  ORF type:complete len:199 (-),score=-7.02 TRINITY_DN1234_c0_g2_i4:294-890(-)